MKKLKIFRLVSFDGEKHFIIQECDETFLKGKVFSEAEAKKTARKEAARPLFITHN